MAIVELNNPLVCNLPYVPARIAEGVDALPWPKAITAVTLFVEDLAVAKQ